jgi:serine/threonine protein kinase HipA of HipAB toxin-antitoxin module
LNDARKHGREAKQKFKDRCLEIERKRFDALKEKQEALRKKRKKSDIPNKNMCSLELLRSHLYWQLLRQVLFYIRC